MNYQEMMSGIFLERPNRFRAQVLINGKEETVHVKNTGRCRELLIPGVPVFLEKSNNPNRKTQYSLIAVQKGSILVNMDSQAPNAVAAEALAAGKLHEIGMVDTYRREVTKGNSRFDLFFKKGKQEGFIEVKGVTLEEDGIARFPDAPTLRGKKHLEELAQLAKEGYLCAVLFLIQMKGCHLFCPHWERDLGFSQALVHAASCGVKILVYDCVVTENSLSLDRAVPYDLSCPTDNCNQKSL